MRYCSTAFWRTLAGLALATGLATVAGPGHAQVYSFGKHIGGGSGLGDAKTKQIIGQGGSYVCLSVTPGTTPDTVRFTVWSRVPQPASRITAIAIDPGRHAGLLGSVGVTATSPGVKAIVVAAHTHPFLNVLKPAFWVDIPHRNHTTSDGMTPGKMVVLSATLGPGKTYVDVLNALHEGFDPVQGTRGLRLGVIILYMLGGPPPGVGSVHDDGGFYTSVASGACR